MLLVPLLHSYIAAALTGCTRSSDSMNIVADEGDGPLQDYSADHSFQNQRTTSKHPDDILQPSEPIMTPTKPMWDQPNTMSTVQISPYLGTKYQTAASVAALLTLILVVGLVLLKCYRKPPRSDTDNLEKVDTGKHDLDDTSAGRLEAWNERNLDKLSAQLPPLRSRAAVCRSITEPDPVGCGQKVDEDAWRRFRMLFAAKAASRDGSPARRPSGSCKSDPGSSTVSGVVLNISGELRRRTNTQNVGVVCDPGREDAENGHPDE
ncbi:hypothetical protein TruAng_006655 [Truncatella angustata]|nr:hypothetical protein TruAng_006655 [Truncatella angustata]